MSMSETEPDRSRHVALLRNAGQVRKAPHARRRMNVSCHDLLAAISQDRPFGFPKLGRPLHAGTDSVDPAGGTIDLPDGAS